ncbi:hypothetical protein GQ53DRAFT_836886 [Thozetella sp. PMI_491]|nr:hypothetical protein GQ53DRAFT_836886 [Thozetella sp. PMI_491]
MATLRFHRRDSLPATFIPPPPGLTSNFVNPPDQSYIVLVPAFVLAALSLVSLTLRGYAVGVIVRNWGMADYLLVPSWLFATAFSITMVFMVKAGMGRHLWDVPFSSFNINFMKVTAVGGTFYGMSIMLTKLSILTFYLRFVTTSPTLKYLIYATMLIVIIYSLVTSWSWLYICQPIAKYWDFTLVGGTCIDFKIIAIVSGIMNSVTDAIILVLPVPILWNLRLPMLQKIGATMIMMTGGLCVVMLFVGGLMLTQHISVQAISIMRTVSAFESLSFDDLSWDATSEEVWWLVEVHLAIVCACLISIKPLIRKYFPANFERNDEFPDRPSVSWRRRTLILTPGFPPGLRQADETPLKTISGKDSHDESERLGVCLHIDYVQIEGTDEVNNPTVAALLRQHASFTDTKQAAITAKKGYIKELEYELQEFTLAPAQFSNFLKRNAMMPYNDGTLDSIDRTMEEEREKVEAGGSKDRLQRLIQYHKRETGPEIAFIATLQPDVEG